jgi:hypothetical protein
VRKELTCARTKRSVSGLSLALGASIGLSTYFGGKYFGATGMMLGYFLLYLLIGLGVGTPIFSANVVSGTLAQSARRRHHQDGLKLYATDD